MRCGTLNSLTVGVGFLLAAAASARADQIKWVSSYAEAKKLAKKSDRLIMLDFYADW